MQVTIIDDYQRVVRTLPCFSRLGAHEVTIHHDPAGSEQALIERLKDTEALLLVRERTAITRTVIEALPKLRLISLTGPVPHVDFEACARRGVTVCSTLVSAGGPSYGTVELTWGLILAGWRRIPQEMASLRAGRWQSPHALAPVLRGRTLGIHGYGRLGALVAAGARAFGMQVLAWGREGSRARAVADGVEFAASQMDLYERSDVVSLHLQLNDKTRHCVRAEHLAAMKEGSLFVNTARAGLVEPGALIVALKKGRPSAAAVDVFESEPLYGVSHPLLDLPNVVATPHLGYVTREGVEAMFTAMIEQVLAFDAGKPINVVTHWP